MKSRISFRPSAAYSHSDSVGNLNFGEISPVSLEAELGGRESGCLLLLPLRKLVLPPYVSFGISTYVSVLKVFMPETLSNLAFLVRYAYLSNINS